MKYAKRSLFVSAISLLLCISMLVGTTFAWFTDGVSSGSNVITSGNLDLDVQYTLDGTNWNDLEGATDLFQKGLWEPGHTEVVALKISNIGSLALKYVANMKIFEEAIGKTKTGEDIVLSDILTVSTLAQPADATGVNSVMLAFMGENHVAYETTSSFKSANILGQDKELLPGDSHYVIIKVDMAETVGNEANHDGVNVPSIDFGISVFATQYTYESDSFGNQYDLGATYDDLADTAILATETKTLGEGDDAVTFNLVYNGMTVARVNVPADALADATQPVTVTFDGIDPAQTITVGDNTKAYAFDITVTNLKENLADDQLVTVVVTAPIALAELKAYHNGELIEDAVYDEVAGTITFKTASFSPYAFQYTEMEAGSLEALRNAVKESNVEIKLTADLEIDLTKGTGAARSDDHVLKSGNSTYYNAVNIVGQNVAIDLNGHKITVFCGDAYNSNSDVGALFFVTEDGSLNIIDRAGGGFIKMESSIYMVWAPYESPSYVDIYSGAFIADSYAGDPIGTPVDGNGNYDPANGNMKNENSNRALIYAGFGGNMNIYGGYFLYNNTPNDTLDRNNGAFNAKDFYEDARPLITIHDGVKLINKEYRQNPANTSRPDGSYDNYSIKLAKDCDIALLQSTAVVIDGKAYSNWYTVLKGINSISASAKNNVYNIGHNFTTDDFVVNAFSENGSSGAISNFTISDVDTSTTGQKVVTVTYTRDGAAITTQCVVSVLNLGDTTNTIKAPSGNNPLYQQFFSTGNFNVSGWANAVGGVAEPSYANMVGKTYEAPNGEIVTGFNVDIVDGTYGENYYDLTVTNAKQYTTLGINCLVAYDDVNNPVKGFGCYIDDDRSTLTWNSPAIVYIGSGQAGGNLPGTSYQVSDDVYNLWGANNAYSLTTMNCANLKAGQTYTVHWVVVFEDGLSELAQWTVKMADLSSSDAMFEDTEKPNANVIIMAGQSNMFGASPLTQTVKAQYAGHNFSNVFIQYNNINFDVAQDGSIPGTLSTVFSNSEFEKYKLGIGGQSDSYFGPETTLAAILSTTEGLKEEKWFIIKYAAAGTALGSQWTGSCEVNGKTTSLTDDMLNYVESALAELSGEYDVKIQSFMWMQGESDAINKTTAENYAGLEKNLVERVRNRFAAYATRVVGSIPGSGISFINAGIADNDTDWTTAQGGPNDWVYAELVNAGKISNSQWLCSIVGANTESALTTGPLKGYTFGPANPTIRNPNQSNVIVNSIYIDTHHLLSKLNSTNEHPEYAEGDRTDWAHYGAGAMDQLGSLFGSCLHYLMITDHGGPVEYTITFDEQGGTVTGESTVYKYAGEKITLPDATRAGHTFNGWYTQPTEGDLIGKAGEEYLVNGNVTMYAQWTEVPKVQYTVKYNADGGESTPAEQKVDAGTKITLAAEPTRSGYSFNGWSDGNKTYDAGAEYTVNSDVTFTAQWTEEGCVTPDTLITLANGSQVRVDSLTGDELLLVWDFFKGEYAAVPAALIVNHGYGDWTVIKLTFEDGTEVKAIGAHSFFDADTNKWELINAGNAKQYIGDSFVRADGNSYSTVKLVAVDVYQEYTESYSLVSAIHYNFITENMFSLTNSVHNMLQGLVVGKNMTYDQKIMAKDLMKYGKYTYADFADYITYEQYIAFNGDYLKISVGKGYITFEDILILIENYL